jgi:hypothetical protein
MAHIPAASYPICPLCSEHIELEKANTDDKGRAVHEECYVAHIIEQNRAQIMFSPTCSLFGHPRLDKNSTNASTQL